MADSNNPISISSGTIDFTISGNNANTIELIFQFNDNSVGSVKLQPPTLDSKGDAGSKDSGSFAYDLTLQPPAGQVQGTLTANTLTVTPTTGEPVTITGTLLVSWDSDGTVITQYNGGDELL